MITLGLGEDSGFTSFSQQIHSEAIIRIHTVGSQRGLLNHYALVLGKWLLNEEVNGHWVLGPTDPHCRVKGWNVLNRAQVIYLLLVLFKPWK